MSDTDVFLVRESVSDLKDFLIVFDFDGRRTDGRTAGRAVGRTIRRSVRGKEEPFRFVSSRFEY